MTTISTTYNRPNVRRLVLERLQERAMFAADLSVEFAVAAVRTAGDQAAAAESAEVGIGDGQAREFHPFDVNEDGAIDREDSQAVIDYVSNEEVRSADQDQSLARKLDVSGDGHVSPIDALQIINYVATTRAEGESAPESKEFVGPLRPYDVDRSGTVDLDDARLTIELLEKEGTHSTTVETARFDTNRDGYVSPADAVVIFNEIGIQSKWDYDQYAKSADELLADHQALEKLTELVGRFQL